MKNKRLVVEHSDMMFHSQELIFLHIPFEINLMIYVILILFGFLGASLFFVKINDVKKVSGIVKTMENNSTVRNVIPGKIKKRYYSPDQFVRKDEILYVLEEDSFRAVEDNLITDISNIEQQLLCVNMLIDGFNSGKNQISRDENYLIFSQLDEYFTTVAYYEEQIGILEYRYLKEINVPEVLFNQYSVEEARRNLSLSQKELEKFKSEFLVRVLQLKNSYEIELEKYSKELIKLRKDNSFLVIRAPVDGYIQEISSLNEGDYIFSDQAVVNIIPSKDKNFRVEMGIDTKDIGEIVPGMTVKYRLSAFPFFEYKGAQGKITFIDSDIRENSNGLVFYLVCADIDKVLFTNSQGKEYPLRAGIEVDARIVLEKISLIHYILRKLDFVK